MSSIYSSIFCIINTLLQFFEPQYQQHEWTGINLGLDSESNRHVVHVQKKGQEECCRNKLTGPE